MRCASAKLVPPIVGGFSAWMRRLKSGSDLLVALRFGPSHFCALEPGDTGRAAGQGVLRHQSRRAPAGLGSLPDSVQGDGLASRSGRR